MEILVRSGDGSGGSEAGGLSEDQVFSLLATGRRREVLRCLRGSDGDLPLSELTRAVALAEGIEPDAAASEFKKVYVSLYQSHLPVLEDAGVLEYDTESKDVRLTPRADPLFAYLDLAETSGESATGGLISRLFHHPTD